MNITRGINHIGLTVPNIGEATEFFKEGLGAKVAYDSQTYADNPRGGEDVEHFLGLSKGTKIIKKRMLVIGNGPSIEMFEFVDGDSRQPLKLEDYGYTHLSFYTDNIEEAFEQLKQAGGEPLSDLHENTRYEDTEGNATVYVKAPWGSLIELQTVPNGYYYPENSEAEVFVPKKTKD